MSGYRKISMTHQQGRLEGVLQTSMHQFGDGILCTLSPNHNVHRENGFYQQWTTNALKSKSVLEMHFPAICRSKFNELANKTVKKLNLQEKNGSKSACIKAYLSIYLVKVSNGNSRSMCDRYSKLTLKTLE